MGANLPISLLGGLAAGEASAWASRTRRKIGFLAAAALLGLTAWSLAVTAAVLALAQDHGGPTAALAGALALSGLAVAVIATMRFAEWMRQRKARRDQSHAALLATAAMIALPSVVRSRPLLALALVGGGGLLASRMLDANREQA